MVSSIADSAICIVNNQSSRMHWLHVLVRPHSNHTRAHAHAHANTCTHVPRVYAQVRLFPFWGVDFTIGVPLKKDVQKFVAVQVLRGLALLHILGVCHRDVKPSNVLQNPVTHE